MTVHERVTELIGNTPVLRLDPARHGIAGVDLHLKLEFLNPFGSVKDRVAWGMLRDHVDRLVREGKTLVEASSGNTAKALQVLAGLHGLALEVVTNRVKVTEVRDVLLMLGTRFEELPGLSECPDPTVPDDVFSVIEARMAAAPGRYFHTSQYTNEDNVRTHRETTGPEIHADVPHVDVLVGGLGTTGSTRGAAEYLRSVRPGLRVLGVVATAEDFIPGIRSESEMWDVGLFDKGLYDDIAAVRSADAVEETFDLALRHGVLAGPTTGAAVRALRDAVARDPVPAGTTRTAVVIACDRLEGYVSYLRARRPQAFGDTGEHLLASVTPVDVAAVPPLLPADLRAAPAGRYLVVDTRGAMAYRVGHVPGALNIRDDHLEAMLAQGVPFPPDARVVLVCPVGEYSARVAALLRRRGREALSLTGGVVAWRDAGFPLERSPS